MSKPQPSARFITDEHGERVAAIVDLECYQALLEAAEGLEEIRAFDAATESGEAAVPLEQVLREIREDRS